MHSGFGAEISKRESHANGSDATNFMHFNTSSNTRGRQSVMFSQMTLILSKIDSIHD